MVCYYFIVIFNNKKTPKKKKVLRYEPFNRVERWNYCQLIAKFIMDSSISSEELKNVLLEIQSGQFKLVLNIEHE